MLRNGNLWCYSWKTPCMWFGKAVLKKKKLVNIPWLESTQEWLAGGRTKFVDKQNQSEKEKKKWNVALLHEPSTCRMAQSLEWWRIRSVTLEYNTVCMFVRSLRVCLPTKCTHVLSFNSVMEVPIDGASTRSVQVKCIHTGFQIAAMKRIRSFSSSRAHKIILVPSAIAFTTTLQMLFDRPCECGSTQVLMYGVSTAALPKSTVSKCDL